MNPINKEYIKNLTQKGNRAAVGAASTLLADTDPNFMLMYADSGCRFGADIIKQKHPEKCIQGGIAEQNIVGVASAMANEGFNVFVVAYGPFITARVLDQIRVNMSIMESPVVLVGLGSGMFMSDLGPASTGLEDLAHTRSMPNITVISPADCTETVKAMLALSEYNKPAYLRVTCGFENQSVYQEDYNFEIGKAITLKEGKDVVIIATGTIVYQCLEAANLLEENGISCAVVNMHTIKPLDTQVIDKFINCRMIATVEEHNTIGGLGGAVAEYLSGEKNAPVLRRIGTPDKFVNADSFAVTLERVGLSKEGIAKQIVDALESRRL